jgi:hypothetical protein
MSDKRNWLILSLKWSKGDWLKWYATACAGYTSSLIHAGRYTEAEARGEQERCPEHCLAVSLDWAIERTAGQVVLRNDGRTVNKLKRLSAKARTKEGKACAAT